jgi:hypothetical protein
MAAITKKYDLELSKIGDEELVVLAQECGFRPATNELLRRHHSHMSRLIAYQAKQTPLAVHDLEDAQQNAVFALVEAIAGYNTLEMVKPSGCRFRTYGRLVTMRRFWNISRAPQSLFFFEGSLSNASLSFSRCEAKLGTIVSASRK